ncbi:eukaryotic translation initiation factor subunit [Rhizodiscina lignyota]|uniref:Clustered mitochondria protein homolog n=1 Tax=Rhizodiscina lignyota TaxID=1504668 RepID=A0A9P4IIB0_9PEZI|nr:eukaryotic translation initiation factor subunit [Rhizodiscina lignyota]
MLGVFELTIRLPHPPHKTEIHVSLQEQVQDIRQSIIDLPFTMRYTCFHLEHKGQKINDFVELSEVPDVGPGSEFVLVEDPYTEKDARLHFVRIRELIGAAGDRTDTTHGILAGVSLHDDITQSAIEGTGKSASSISAEYDFDAPASYEALLPHQQPAAPKTVKTISVSPWSPPPYHLRMRGHLLYIQVTTNEGDQVQITSHTAGFYVNRSTKDKFDPSPKLSNKDLSAHSLLTLLGKISPSFDYNFRALTEENGKKDPLTMFSLQNAVPASPWLVPPPTSSFSTHYSDLTRSQESYLYAGAENADSLRDWNEEFQSMRELPKEQMQERVFRERLTSKLFADFTEAAARGAVLVARGDVLALNPTENRDAQIFVYNNIFFSFGADGMGTFASDGGDEAARVATGKDVVGVKAVNQLDITGLFTPGTVIIDYLGKRIVAQSIVPGIFKQREPGEPQVDYGGVEGKDVVAENEAFAPLFQQLSQQMYVKKHPVWDKEDKRHELEGSIETKGLLGTDGRKYVLDLYRITPLDVAWLEKYWSKPEGEVKDPEKSYPHRMAVLRPELVASYARVKLGEFVQAELAKRNEKTEGEHKNDESAVVSTKNGEAADKTEEGESKGAEVPHIDASNFKFSLNPDVFCDQTPQTDEEKEELAKDEEEVRAVCDYLTSKIIPTLIQELQEGDVGFPMDGESLSTLLHKRGINMRYLGQIATLADNDSQRLQALRQLTRQEMVTRSFKHIANKKMRHLPPPAAAACVSHLLNCLLGAELNAKPEAETDELIKSLYGDVDFGYEQTTPESLKQEILDQIRIRFRYEFKGDIVQSDRQMQLLREVSLKLGLQLEAREYTFAPCRATNGVNGVNGHAAAPGSNGEPHVNGSAKKANKKKKKGSDQGSPHRAAPAHSQTLSFHPDDVLNIVPVIKEASPRSVLAEDAFEAGRISIHQGDKQRGQTLLLESLSLYEQIYGILHPEVASAYSQLSSLYYGLEEKAAAIELARKAVIVSERTLGVDSSMTILSYLNLGLFEHASGNGELALRYILHALELLKIVYGPKHPDSITTINNGAVMLQQLKKYPESRVWFEASLTLSEQVSGKDSVANATLLYQLAQALALDNESRGAVNKMRDAYNIFKDKLGADNANTKDAATWLERLTQNAVVQAKREKVLAELPIRPIRGRVQGAGMRNPLPQIGQSREEALGGRKMSVGGQREMDERNIEELIKYIEGGDAGKTTPKKKPQTKRRIGRVS